MNPTTQKQDVENLAKMFMSKIPKVTNYNNSKSRKYFSSKINEQINDNTLTIKDTLLYNSSTSGTLSISTSNHNNSITNLNFNKNENVNNIIKNNISSNRHKKNNSSNFLIVSKEILKYAEPQSTPKIFYKLPAKFIEEIIVESDEEDLTENIPMTYKQNKTMENLNKKKKKHNKTEDSILQMKEKLNNTDIEQLIPIQKLNINFDSLTQMEQIYQNFIHLLESKKSQQSEYDNLIIKYFETVTDFYQSIYTLENCLNDISVQKNLKEFFIQEIIIFTLCYMRNLDKNDQLQNAFKNCFFHLNQNLIILLFISTVICENNIKDETYIKCNKKVEDNKIWLNKFNYKKYLKNNNKIVSGVIRNILKQIKSEDKNLGIIVNYIKNIQKFKTDVIRDNIYKNFILNKVNIKTDDEVNEENKYNNDEMISNNITVNIIPPSIPFLPEKLNYSRRYTLVLDLDETLVHYVEDEDSAYIQIRPGAENFLEEMFEYYEIVIFTAALQDYADLVLDELDKNKRISYRLYRHHTLNVDNFYIKDLSKLGRKLSRTLIIDNVADNFQLQNENGINIINFEGNENDLELIEMTDDLKNIVKFEIDVRDALPKIREKMNQRIQNINLNQIVDSLNSNFTENTEIVDAPEN